MYLVYGYCHAMDIGITEKSCHAGINGVTRLSTRAITFFLQPLWNGKPFGVAVQFGHAIYPGVTKQFCHASLQGVTGLSPIAIDIL